jgi:hypothetical protein
MYLPRFQYTLQRMIVFVGIVALLLGVCFEVRRRNEAWKAYAVAMSDLQRAADRVEWAEQMHKKGYVSEARLVTERLGFQSAQHSLQEAQRRVGR